MLYFYMQLNDRIKKLRKARGLTQTELAETLKVRQQVIGSYETGFRKPPIERLPDLAKALDVSLEQLLGKSSIPTTKNTHPKINRNKRTAKIQELLEKLSLNEQRVVLKQVELLAKNKTA